jgi:hypothetical protein
MVSGVSNVVVCVVTVVIVGVFVGVVAGCDPIVPSDACVQYVDCQAAYDDAAGLDPVDTAARDKDGDCWSTPEFADRCDAESADAVDSLRAAADAADLRVEQCDPPAESPAP